MRIATLAAAVAASLLCAQAIATSYDPTVAMSSLYFAKIGYCPAAEIGAWNCGESCQYHSGFQVKGVYTNSSIESQGYSGYDPNTNTIILAFRGSSNIPNWLSDLNFFKTTYPNPSCGCEVHRGFLHEWQSLAIQAMPDLQALYAQYGAPIRVVGHSLGAATSILAAMDVVTHISSDVSVYNFGEPRVGTSAFSQWASGRLPAGKQFRVTHKRDPVPHVPPMLLDFLHAPHELWYDNDGDTTYDNCADSPTHESPDCSDSIIPYGIDDHLLYLGICTECSCDSKRLIDKYGPKVAARLLARMSKKNKSQP